MKRWILSAFVVMVINLYGADTTVNIHLKDGSIFTCDKVLSEKGSFVIVENKGKKLLLSKTLIESIERMDIKPTLEEKKVKIDESLNDEDKETFVIDDLNFIRTVFFDPYAKIEKEQEQQSDEEIKIKIVSQKVERMDNKIKFDGEVQNIYGEDVESLKMIVSALDKDGKVIVENETQVSPNLGDGSKVPFSFVFADEKSEIVRFSYRFEGVVRKAQTQNENNQD